jgi:bla regulator protein blaR1
MRLRINPLLRSAACLAIGGLQAQSPDVPDWQIAAGGRAAFEVASVKPAKGIRPPLFPLNLGDAKPSGGRFSFTFPLLSYIAFAYKLMPAEISAKLPKSFPMDSFDIEARAPGNPTKDQMRLMMQSLLADRFKLKAHFETREGPVFLLMLVRPGQTGPKLRPHTDGPACPDSFEMFPASKPPPKVNDAFPPNCGVTQIGTTPNGKQLLASRNMTMETIAEEAIHNFGSLAGEIDKPVVDQTGLRGRYDFALELPAGTLSFFPAPPNADAIPGDPKGTPFLIALREQLGLKLLSSKGPIRKLVIDRVEPPSGKPNGGTQN